MIASRLVQSDSRGSVQPHVLLTVVQLHHIAFAELVPSLSPSHAAASSFARQLLRLHFDAATSELCRGNFDCLCLAKAGGSAF